MASFYKAPEIKRSVRLDKNHFFYFHPSKRDSSGLKGVCQRLFNEVCFDDVALVLARPFQSETILFRWMKIETTQLNQCLINAEPII